MIIVELQNASKTLSQWFIDTQIHISTVSVKRQTEIKCFVWNNPFFGQREEKYIDKNFFLVTV